MASGPILVQENAEFFGTVKIRGAVTLIGAQTVGGAFGVTGALTVTGASTLIGGVRAGVATNAYITDMLLATASVGASLLPVTAATIKQFSVTVTGAAIGDQALVTIASAATSAMFPATVTNITGWVSTANTVTVNVSNPTAVAGQIATGAIITVIVQKFSK